MVSKKTPAVKYIQMQVASDAEKRRRQQSAKPCFLPACGFMAWASWPAGRIGRPSQEIGRSNRIGEVERGSFRAYTELQNVLFICASWSGEEETCTGNGKKREAFTQAGKVQK